MRVRSHPHAISLARSRSLGPQALPIHNQTGVAALDELSHIVAAFREAAGRSD